MLAATGHSPVELLWISGFSAFSAMNVQIPAHQFNNQNVSSRRIIIIVTLTLLKVKTGLRKFQLSDFVNVRIRYIGIFRKKIDYLVFLLRNSVEKQIQH